MVSMSWTISCGMGLFVASFSSVEWSVSVVSGEAVFSPPTSYSHQVTTKATVSTLVHGILFGLLGWWTLFLRPYILQRNLFSVSLQPKLCISKS